MVSSITYIKYNPFMVILVVKYNMPPEGLMYRSSKVYFFWITLCNLHSMILNARKDSENR